MEHFPSSAPKEINIDAVPNQNYILPLKNVTIKGKDKLFNIDVSNLPFLMNEALKEMADEQIPLSN